MRGLKKVYKLRNFCHFFNKDILYIIGKEKLLKRIESIIDKLIK